MTDFTYAELPVPAVHRRGAPSVIWLVPILALVTAITLGVRAYLRSGPTIRVTFDTADGLEAGKSDVRFRNVPIGKVETLAVSSDRRHVIATLSLLPEAAPLAVRDTRFWVERPRLGIAGVSGLGTIVSGGYIGVDAGASKEIADAFVGLERPPGVLADQRGRRFRLTTTDAGSLTLHAPIYLRHVAVGWISAVDLDRDGKHATVDVFVQAPFEDTVTAQTVFWNASGVDVTIDARGLHLDTQSVATIVSGGLAYDVRDTDASDHPAPADTMFALYEDRTHAMLRPGGLQIAATMRFAGSTRGVAAGAGLDFEGVTIGTVDLLRPGYDPVHRTFFTDIDATVYPERLGAAYTSLALEGRASNRTGVDLLRALVDRGLRAQIRAGNLLTGQGYLALAWIPHGTPLVGVGPTPATWVIPTEQGGVDRMQEQVQDIVAKIDALPIAQIGRDAQQTIADLHRTAAALRDDVAAPDSALRQALTSTLDQIQRAAFSLRGLADLLQQHPESLLRGRK